MGDLPDWIQAQQNSGTELVGGTLAAGVANSQSVTGNDSVVLYAFAALPNSPVILQVDWYTDDTLGTYVTTQYFTAAAETTSAASIVVEIPCYAGAIKVTNNSPGGITFTLVGAARVVTVPRVLQFNTPSRVFGLATTFVNGTGVLLLPEDGLDGNYATNGTAGLSLGASVNGRFAYNYIDASGTARTLTISTVTANTTLNLTIPLPQGAGVFAFVPAAGGVGTCLVIAAPAQL